MLELAAAPPRSGPDDDCARVTLVLSPAGAPIIFTVAVPVCVLPPTRAFVLTVNETRVALWARTIEAGKRIKKTRRTARRENLTNRLGTSANGRITPPEHNFGAIYVADTFLSNE